MRQPLRRSVPWSLQRGVLFGGFHNQFGWAFLGFGMIFVWVFLPHTDLTSWYHFRQPTATVTGKIQDSWRTGFSSGGGRRHTSRRRGAPIYAHSFMFRTKPDAPLRQGISYASRRQLSPGSDVKIEYVVERENISRIEGMRRAAMPPWVAVLAIFPAVGLAFLIFGVSRGIRQRRLLARGRIAAGKKVAKRGTDVTINGRKVYELTFEFKDDHGATHQTRVKTHRPRALEDDAEETLLYDPVNPSRAVLMDSLPCRARLDRSAQFECDSRNYLVLVMPALVIICNIVAALLVRRL
jgi:hypothetical protein